MRQAIVTKYLGPTNHRGSRIKATAQAGSMIFPWNDEWDAERNHRNCAEIFMVTRGWDCNGMYVLAGGALPDDAGYAFVLIDNPKRAKLISDLGNRPLPEEG